MKRTLKIELSLIIFSLMLPALVLAQHSMFSPYGDPRMTYGQSWYEYPLAQHFFALLFGALLGAFFSDKLREFRKWLIGTVVALVLLVFSFSSVTGANIAFFALGFLGAYFALKDRIKQILEKAPKPTTFGSAEWADLEHLKTHELIGEKGFALGFYEEAGQKHPLQYTGDRHLLTIAPTRSGKGVSSIIPNLLTYEGSVIVIDPKGENARITEDRRGTGERLGIQGMKQKVHIVDPWGITGLTVSRFNPMDWLDPEDEDINENAMMLADSIVTPQPGALEPFWDEEAKALLMGILLYVALDWREQSNRTLSRVREIICMGAGPFKDVMLQMVESTNPIISSTAERTLSKDPKLRSNVLASLQAHTHFLDSPRIQESLQFSDFRFEDLKTSKMTIYLVLPADRLNTFGRWLRLLIQQAITVNARNIETKPDKPILFLLDEMASLGRLTMVEQAFSLMAGFGMQLWGIVQDLSQLERIYEKGWETFIGNSGVLQYFGSRDHKTADYFSKLCGVTTISKFSFTNAIARALGWSSSSTSGGQGGGSSTSGSSSSTTWSDSTTEDVVQRHLAFPDELMVLREGKQLLMIENFNPIPGKKVIWYTDDKLKAMGVHLKDANSSQGRRPAIAAPSSGISAPQSPATGPPIQPKTQSVETPFPVEKKIKAPVPPAPPASGEQKIKPPTQPGPEQKLAAVGSAVIVEPAKAQETRERRLVLPPGFFDDDIPKKGGKKYRK